MADINSADEFQRVDEDKFNELNEILGEDFGEIVTEFSKIVPDSLDTIALALKSGDTERVFIETHTLKSSSGNIGLARFSHLCAILEEQARNEKMLEPEAQLKLINKEFTAGVDALNEKL